MDQFFMPLSKPYWADLPALRAEVTKADEAAATETDPIRRINAEQHAKALRRQLEDAERQALLDTSRRAPVQPPRPSVNATGEPQYMEPVPYYAQNEQPRPAAPKAGQPVPWPEDFVARTELLSAAVAEVRRLKLLAPLG